jgi:hypothetical protein
MNRTLVLGTAATFALLLGQGVLAGGWMPHHTPGWGPYGN